MVKTLLFAFLITTLSFSKAHAVSCVLETLKVLEQQVQGDSAFKAIELLEGRITNAYQELSTLQASNDSYQQLSSLSNEIEGLQDIVLDDQPISSQSIHDLDSRISALVKTNQNRLKESAEVADGMSNDWDSVVDDFSQVEAYKIYEVHGPELQSPLKITFNEDVVENIFRSNDVARVEYRKKITKILKLGIRGAAMKGPGLKRLRINSSIIELAVIGKSAGRVRIGGMLEDGVLKMVHWSDTGEHNSTKYIMNFRDSVLIGVQRF